MKVKLISSVALTLGLVASSLAPAAALQYKSNPVYKVTANNVTKVYIDGTVGNHVAVDLGTIPKTYSKVAAACGDVKISTPKGNANFTGLTVDGTAIDYASLPTQTLPTCTNGAFAEARAANFKTAKGQVVIVGKTAGATVSVVVNADVQKNIAINGCGVGILNPPKGEALPATFTINGTSYTLANLPDAGEAPVCKKTATGYATYVPQAWSQ